MKKLNTGKQFVDAVNSLDEKYPLQIAKPGKTNSSPGKELIAQLQSKASVNISTDTIMALTRWDE